MADGMKMCIIEGCEKERKKSHRRCGMHLKRLERTGSFGPSGFIVDPTRTVAERVYSRLVAIGDSAEWDCWEWQGALRRGYGTISINKKLIYVHRWVYEDMVAPIPEGLYLDHTCCNHKCANPYHLDPVTNEENVARGGYSSGYRRVAA